MVSYIAHTILCAILSIFCRGKAKAKYRYNGTVKGAVTVVPWQPNGVKQVVAMVMYYIDS